jgi:excisionase family DNA binding protein
MSNEDTDVQNTPLPLADTTDLPALLDVGAVAKMLGCSARHVWRLADRGAMPKACRLGALVRWQRSAIEEWIGKGCPTVRKATGR